MGKVFLPKESICENRKIILLSGLQKKKGLKPQDFIHYNKSFNSAFFLYVLQAPFLKY